MVVALYIFIGCIKIVNSLLICPFLLCARAFLRRPQPFVRNMLIYRCWSPFYPASLHLSNSAFLSPFCLNGSVRYDLTCSFSAALNLLLFQRASGQCSFLCPSSPFLLPQLAHLCSCHCHKLELSQALHWSSTKTREYQDPGCLIFLLSSFWTHVPLFP